MRQYFTIQGRLPGLNEYTQENRKNRYAGAALKLEAESLVSYAIVESRLKRIDKPVVITFCWIEKNKRRDLDNICFAKKFILDALVKKGILDDDGWKCVKGLHDQFHVDKDNPRIIVVLEELEKDDFTEKA